MRISVASRFAPFLALGLRGVVVALNDSVRCRTERAEALSQHVARPAHWFLGLKARLRDREGCGRMRPLAILLARKDVDHVKYLVFCPCGHSLDRHATLGCDGNEPSVRCACNRNEERALEAALAMARLNPWGGPLDTPKAG